MSATACFRSLFLLLFAFVSLNTICAHACSATSQDVFVVGNTATDAACDYNTIQAAIDAATCAAGTRIYLTSEVAYTAQHLSITNKNVSLIGRKSGTSCGALTAACGINFPCPTTPLETISGDGHTGDSVIAISGTSNVAVQYLTVSDGDAGGRSGGGIDYNGAGTLTLETSTVSDNAAFRGGGIHVKGAGGPANLLINANTLIIDNIATDSGGGISLEIGATMTMNAPNTWIALNQATGSGGGIDVAYAKANIGSGGYLFGAAIYANTASYGGGIGVHDNSFLDLYTTDPLHPVAIDNNTAYNTGGGIYINQAQLCAADFRLTNNTGKEGSGLYADGAAYVNPGSDANCSLADLGSVPCDASQQCNIVHGNIALDVKNHNVATDGAAIRVWDGAVFIADKLDVRANQGGYALHVEGNPALPADPTHVELTNCLFAENLLTHELMLAYNGTSQVSLMNCTLARDTLGAGHVLSTNDMLKVNDSIFAEGPIPVALGGAVGDYNLAENISGLSGISYPGTPAFIDAQHGDYRLFYGLQGGQLIKSPGIDYAPAVDGDDRDIRGLPRDQAIYNSFYGDRDLGAYEMQGVGDRIFIDAFGDDMLLVH